MTGGRALLDDGVGDGDLVSDVAGLLDAGSDGANQRGLLAVAGEVGQGRAAIGGQGRDEAAQRAAGDVGELSVGQTGSNEGNQGGGELHFDGESAEKAGISKGERIERFRKRQSKT